MRTVQLVVLLRSLLPSFAHAHPLVMWLRIDHAKHSDSSHARAFATWSEAGGGWGDAHQQHGAENRTTAWLDSCELSNKHHEPVYPKKVLKLALEKGPKGTAALVSPIDKKVASQHPFLLESHTVAGLRDGHKQPKLVISHASTAALSRPYDWVCVSNDWTPSRGAARNLLSLSLRDPAMVGGVTGEGVLSPPLPASPNPADECGADEWYREGDACVVAVVIFNGTLLNYSVNLTTFAAADDGTAKQLRVAPSRGGVTVLRFPYKDGEPSYIYASVSYVEQKNGSYQNTTYSAVEHWATTSAVLHRHPHPHNKTFPPPPPAAAPPPPAPDCEAREVDAAYNGALAGALVAILLIAFVCGLLLMLAYHPAFEEFRQRVIRSMGQAGVSGGAGDGGGGGLFGRGGLFGGGSGATASARNLAVAASVRERVYGGSSGPATAGAGEAAGAAAPMLSPSEQAAARDQAAASDILGHGLPRVVTPEAATWGPAPPSATGSDA